MNKNFIKMKMRIKIKAKIIQKQQNKIKVLSQKIKINKFKINR